MATISYKCDECKRTIELVENPQGFTVVGKCVITSGCIGRLYKTERNPNNVRESYPKYIDGLNNYVPRRTLFQYTQVLPSNKWKITHDMGVLPSVFVYLTNDNITKLVDNSTYTVESIDKNNILIIFSEKVKGVVQCIAKSSVPLVPNTEPVLTNQYQVSSSGIITFAIPKYLTQIQGQIPQVSAPIVTPTITPSPTPTTTPINLPINLCAESNIIQLEIEITKPNADPIVCFERIENTTDSRSPWNGWGEVLVGKRRNYCIRTASLLKLKVFGNAELEANDIPNGTRIRFLRIDYGTNRNEIIPSRGLLMLLSKYPHAYADKVKDKVVDVGELIGDTPNYFVYNNGELFLDESKIERSYPDISRVIYQSAPPIPSPTPTPTVTTTITSSVTPTVTATVSVTSSPTPTPSIDVTPTPTPTISLTPTVIPSQTVTPTPTITPSTSSTIELPFYALGKVNSGDTNKICKTNNDLIWGAPFTPSGVPFTSNGMVAAENGRLILTTGNVYYSDDDGISFTMIPVSGTINSACPPFALNSTILIPLISSDGLLRSDDNGITFNTVAAGKSSVRLGASNTVIVSISSESRPMYSTDDGITWSALGDRLDSTTEAFNPFSMHNASDGNDIVFGGQIWGGPFGISSFINGIAKTSDGFNFTFARVSNSTSYVSCIGYNDGRWFAGCSNGDIFYSPDTITWTYSGNADGLIVNNFTVTQNILLISASSNTGTAKVYMSDDNGITWTDTNCPLLYDIKSLIFQTT